MKRIINTAIIYGVLALIGGVVFREVTKFANYTEHTTLSIIHTHLFAMGMLVFLILVSIEKQFLITEHKRFSLFYWTYNVGLCIAVLGFFVRGMLEVYGIEISKGMNAMIAGISGLGHMSLSLGVILMLFIIKKQVLKK